MSVILIDHPCKDDNAQFIMVLFKGLSDKVWIRLLDNNFHSVKTDYHF